uniref:Cytochrome P450 n=1 Tax=Biomphalaria glabrata TaxID=6526 RepID=A0A2C9JYR0_BIOGL
MLCTLVILGVVLLLLVALFVKYMSAHHQVFKKLGIDHPQPRWIVGNFDLAMKHGMFEVQKVFYNKYKEKKVYGWFDARRPVIVVKDLDMFKDILIKNFNHFVDHYSFLDFEPPFHDNLLSLRGDHWKRVRSIISPTFSSGRIKRMASHVEKNAKILLENLQHLQETGEDVELREISSCFTLDVIASTGFGLDINTLKDPKNKFAVEANKVMNGNRIVFFVVWFLPALSGILAKLGFHMLPKKPMEYLVQVIDQIIEERKHDDKKNKVNDFIDLVMNAETEAGQASGKDLTRSEIHSQAIIFLFAGFDTIATALSFTLFHLAMHPECCEKVQSEVDAKCGKDIPDYDKVQTLTYLDMCINESNRLTPPGIFINRQCVEDIDIQGVHFPKDMAVIIPTYAIQTDPKIFPEPEKFDPERFSSENKVNRHPMAFLPFGQGPRNCIGMRLALLELKIALAMILQKLTPIPCSKTVYPAKLSKIQTRAMDGLWVKFQNRKIAN